MDSGLDKKTSMLLERSNKIGIDFLLADLNTGLIFVQVALTTGSAASRTRSLSRALEVHRTVMHLLPRVVPTAQEEMEIERRLEELRTALRQAGYAGNI